MHSDFQAFTLTSDLYHPGLLRLIKSAVKHKFYFRPVHIKRITNYSEFLSNKHLLIRGVLKGLLEADYTRFLYLDAWDTVITGPVPWQVLDSRKLTFGAELNCYPEAEFAASYPKPARPFPYLNSGVIWGPIEEYLELCPSKVEHDQLAWTEKYLLNTGRIQLDTRAEVVLNLHSTSPQDLSRFPDGVRYHPTGTWPCILHGNGGWPLPNFLETA